MATYMESSIYEFEVGGTSQKNFVNGFAAVIPRIRSQTVIRGLEKGNIR